MVIAAADLVPILDSLGVMSNELNAIVTTAEATEIKDGADNNADRILALTDLAVVKDLAAGFDNMNISANAAVGEVGSYVTRQALFSQALAGIQRHVSNLNTYLTNNSVKVSRSFADLWRALYSGGSLQAANVFQDTNVTVATFTYTGAGTGTFLAAAGLDPTLVGPAQLRVNVTTTVTGAAVASLTCQKVDGSTEVKTVNISAGATPGTLVDVGVATDVYMDVTAITSTGGTAGAFKVENKILRSTVI